MMANLKFLNSIVLLFISCISLIGCAPPEPQLELKLENQPVGQVFSFAEYCEEKYDSIYLIQPYDDEEEIYSLPYKMSQRLRDKCSYTMADTYVRILFINKGTVKAYSEIGYLKAYFSTNGLVDDGPIFSFDQRFIMDKDRKVHMHNE